ncbi:MAG: hypothetical protein AAGB46_01150 [Verrucomicrobiota bacterium]
MSLQKITITAAAIAALLLFNSACSKSDDHAHHDHDNGHDHSHGDHSHDHAKKEAGPNGGRIITSVEPHAEFFVREDGKLQIAFLNEDNKVIAPSGQTVTAITGERMSPTNLKFAAQGNLLVSDKPIPEGNNHPTILNFIASAGKEPVMERLNLNLSECPSCDYKEYACVCNHSH